MQVFPALFLFDTGVYSPLADFELPRDTPSLKQSSYGREWPMTKVGMADLIPKQWKEVSGWSYESWIPKPPEELSTSIALEFLLKLVRVAASVYIAEIFS